MSCLDLWPRVISLCMTHTVNLKTWQQPWKMSNFFFVFKIMELYAMHRHVEDLPSIFWHLLYAPSQVVAFWSIQFICIQTLQFLCLVHKFITRYGYLNYRLFGSVPSYFQEERMQWWLVPGKKIRGFRKVKALYIDCQELHCPTLYSASVLEL